MPEGETIVGPQTPREVCGHVLVRWLKPEVTALCVGEGGRSVVLKRLERDCLLDGTLHPEIRERLARIRELAHGQVATLIGVERSCEGAVYGVWEYVDGRQLMDWIADPARDPRAGARMLRELVLAVEAMHDQGIIHGALHNGNIVVDTEGGVRILDLSPLLFDDPRDDIEAIAALMGEVAAQRGMQETAIGKALLEQVGRGGELREYSAAISRLLQVNDSPRKVAEVDGDEWRIRRQALRWAGLCVIVALMVAAWFWWSASRQFAAPQEAPPQALEAK